MRGGYYLHHSDEVGALWASLKIPLKKKPLAGRGFILQ